MALAKLEEFRHLLACPRCQSKVTEDGEGFHCASPACQLAPTGSFPLIDGTPVIVDFDKSILQREHVKHQADRISRIPRPLRALLLPLNRTAEVNTERLISMLSGPAPIVLVVGGATVGSGAAALYSDPRVRVIGFDIQLSRNTQFVADAHRIPLADRSVDAVVVQAVLEHVLDPADVVAEIHRVLNDDGLVYADTPFMQQVHAGAYDFTRFTPSGHRYLFRRFEEIGSGVAGGPGPQLLWSFEYLARGLFRSKKVGVLTRAALFWLRYLDRIVPNSYQMDSASATYFLGRKSDVELSPRDIVAYYQGRD